MRGRRARMRVPRPGAPPSPARDWSPPRRGEGAAAHGSRRSPLSSPIAPGALYWPEEGLLVVADLHLEKGSSFAARGVLLPPYDTAATLARLGSR